MNNLWILTEERPKKEVITLIVRHFVKEKKLDSSTRIETVNIIPLLDENNCFNFTYRVIGIELPSADNIFIKIISGSSSFVDYLIFYQENEPTQESYPLYAIELTKTDDEESRNTGVYQRITKFIFVEHYYPKTKKIMLYYSEISHAIENRTDTYIFGSRILKTLGVEILQNTETQSTTTKPFKNIDELIAQKNSMQVKSNNVSVRMTKTKSAIEISGKLLKGDSLSYDPNIGLLTGISRVLRKLGWKKDIVITQHGLRKGHLGARNKFIRIANKYNISLKGLSIPSAGFPDQYWHYEKNGEKLGTIFIHIVIESFTKGYSIFENHAGCEKGYFKTADGRSLPVKKYTNKKAYKSGDKSKIYYLPDIVLIDKTKKEITTVEGKQFKRRKQGIKELGNYGPFEEKYIKPSYKNFSLKRKVVLFGGNENKIKEIEVAFCLNQNGQLLFRLDAPSLFIRAISKLFAYWKKETLNLSRSEKN